MPSCLLSPRPRHQGLPGIREASGPTALSSEDPLPIGGLGGFVEGVGYSSLCIPDLFLPKRAQLCPATKRTHTLWRGQVDGVCDGGGEGGVLIRSSDDACSRVFLMSAGNRPRGHSHFCPHHSQAACLSAST